jgi:hypothetical protein
MYFPRWVTSRLWGGGPWPNLGPDLAPAWFLQSGLQLEMLESNLQLEMLDGSLQLEMVESSLQLEMVESSLQLEMLESSLQLEMLDGTLQLEMLDNRFSPLCKESLDDKHHERWINWMV